MSRPGHVAHDVGGDAVERDQREAHQDRREAQGHEQQRRADLLAAGAAAAGFLVDVWKAMSFFAGDFAMRLPPVAVNVRDPSGSRRGPEATRVSSGASSAGRRTGTAGWWPGRSRSTTTISLWPAQAGHGGLGTGTLRGPAVLATVPVSSPVPAARPSAWARSESGRSASRHRFDRQNRARSAMTLEGYVTRHRTRHRAI